MNRSYILGRLALLVVTFLVATAAGFALQHLIPGNPVLAILGHSATPSAEKALEHKLGLDKPLWLQYFIWLGRFLRGDWGIAYSDNEPVTTLLAQNYACTLELIVASQILALLLAFVLAVPSSLERFKWMERLATPVSFGFVSVPYFVVGPVLSLVFAAQMHLLPATGYVPLSQSVGQNLKFMALPIITLTLGTFAPYYQILKSELSVTLRQNYIEMAKAKGLPPWRIVLVHALKPSTVTLVTTTGLQLGGLVSGTVGVEYIFGLPGLGKLLINSIQSADYLVVQALTVVIVVAVAVVNFIVDMLYLVIDPRIRRTG